MGTAVVSVFEVLAFVRRHPRTVAFSFSREEIRVENGDVLAILIGHFVGSYIFVVSVNVIHFFEGQSKEFVGYCKRTLQHIFQLKVGF